MRAKVSVLVLTAMAGAFAIAGCARTSVPSLLPAALRDGIVSAPASNYHVLFSFGSDPHGYDGTGPEASLIDVDGALYGTTIDGGAAGEEYGAGTVFKVTTSGKVSVLHSFGTNYDGAYPQANLVSVNATLYGTTVRGGQYGGGTVFSITRSGTEKVLHSFGAPSDGAEPYAGLIAVNGALYGTTAVGGANGIGTVFRMGTSGKESVLHSFSGGSDGSYPEGALLYHDGRLYGTSVYGGLGGGTIFTVTTGGKEAVLYSFDKVADGDHPESALTALDGMFYGTTESGGSADWGTVFSLTPSGHERVLHSFHSDASDGIRPLAGVIAVKGTLYGTTFGGGAGGVGTVFGVDAKTGAETVLHDFSAPRYKDDGMWLQGGLINVRGTLYGTTELGGASAPSCAYMGGCAFGTVFALKP